MEVYRIYFIPGHHYETVEATESVWNPFTKAHKYYTTNTYRYVGRFLRTERIGPYGDGQEINEIFELNGNEVKVPLSYEGFTCFREIPSTVK